MPKLPEPREEFIEMAILEFLMLHKVFVWHNDVKWYYNEKKGHYQRNKNNFVRTGISDIGGVIRPDGIHLAIEVKKPSEMAFFDRSMKELENQMKLASVRGVKDLKKYSHAIEQRSYLDGVLENWGVAFFASSIDEVIQRLQESWINIS